MAEYIDYTQATTLFGDVDARFDTVEGKIPSNASSGNKMVTASDIATKADLVNGLVPANQLPSFVDDVLMGTAQNITETAAGTYSADGFIISGESTPTTLEDGKTYVDTATNIQFRYTGTGSNLVSMGSNLALGETATTAYAGNKGKANADAISDIQDLIPSGASTSNKLATASDIPTVPTALADLTDDSTHRVVTDTEKSTWSGKQDALTFDNTPTANSNNPVKSGGIKTALDDKMSYADNGVLGAKNLCPRLGNTTTITGVTFSVDAENIVTVSGIATANTFFASSKFNLKKGSYVLSQGVITGNSDNRMQITKEDSSVVAKVLGNEDSVSFTLDTDTDVYVTIRINNGTDYTTPKVFKPMITLATDTDSTYAPYAMTNRELTEKVTPSTKQTVTLSDTDITGTLEYTRIGSFVELRCDNLKVTNITGTVTINNAFPDNSYTTPSMIESGFAVNNDNDKVCAMRIDGSQIKIYKGDSWTTGGTVNFKIYAIYLSK